MNGFFFKALNSVTAIAAYHVVYNRDVINYCHLCLVVAQFLNDKKVTKLSHPYFIEKFSSSNNRLLPPVGSTSFAVLLGYVRFCCVMLS